jgi:ATP-binding cassette subfamily B protein
MTNDLNAVRMLLGPAIMYSTNTILFSVGALFFLFRISPELTLLALVPMPLVSILVQMLGRKIHERFERIQAMFSEISAQAQENLSGARLVRAFAQEQAQIEAFERSNQENIRRGLRLVQLMGMLWPTLEFILGVALGITLLVGGHQVLRGQISVGGFVAFNTYMMMLMFPIIALGWVVNLFQRGTASVARIEELLEERPSIDDSAADPALAGHGPLAGAIEFRHLNFGYDGTPVLHDVSLTIPAGSSLAIVGPTGSGKSTLVRLIPRLYDAPEGTLLIDGVAVRRYPLAWLRSQIGMVPQETFLFSESIRENISLGVPEASDEQIAHAAEIAHIRREVEEFPAGFGTLVGERGVTLSGGQRQRLALARAFLTDPAILILDDSTSAIDSATEDKIQRAIYAAARGRTTFIITHRLSQIRWADLIIVLRKGRIAAIGDHEELLRTSEAYRRIFSE